MSGRLDGRVAVITGGASGIGRATVHRFLAEGASVVAADMNEANGAALVAAADEEGSGKQLRFVRADVSKEDDVEGVVRAAVEEFGGLDVIFNNAGVGGAFGPLTDISVDDWDYTFAVMVRGVFLGMKHATRVFIEQGRGGAIVNTASVAGLAGGSAPVAYSAAKAAVINLTRAASSELAANRIRVNAICPGGIATPLISFGGDVAATATRLDAAQPWPEHGEPTDIAAAAVFLASDDARFVTGEALVVDGGLMAAGPGLIDKMAGIDMSKLPVAGVSRGTTGEQADFRPIDPR